MESHLKNIKFKTLKSRWKRGKDTFQDKFFLIVFIAVIVIHDFMYLLLYVSALILPVTIPKMYLCNKKMVGQKAKL